MTDWLLLTHAAATWWMVGLIWFVQVVHYPLFLLAGEPGWPGYASAHRVRTTWVVLPPMVVELATAGVLAMTSFREAPPVEPWLAWTGFVLVALVWGSTFLVQVPLHAKLSTKLCPITATRLVRTNWVRTALWTIRGAIALVMISPSAPG